MQAQAKSGSRSSKQTEKGKAVASAPVTPVKKGRAAAKRAAEPSSERQPVPKKAAKGHLDPVSEREQGPQKAAEPSKGTVPLSTVKPPQTPAKQQQEAATNKPAGMSACIAPSTHHTHLLKVVMR